VEGLEDRLALSTSSAAIHAVLDNTGHSVAYYIERASGNLNEKTDLGSIQSLGNVPAGTQFSAGLDSNGFAEVYRQASPGGNIQVFSDAGGIWMSTNAPIQSKSFAAVKGGWMYAIGTDGSLWQCQAPGASFLKFLLSGERDMDAFCEHPRRRRRRPRIEVYPKRVTRPGGGPTKKQPGGPLSSPDPPSPPED
jgi:hypothetical protein